MLFPVKLRVFVFLWLLAPALATAAPSSQSSSLPKGRRDLLSPYPELLAAKIYRNLPERQRQKPPSLFQIKLVQAKSKLEFDLPDHSSSKSKSIPWTKLVLSSSHSKHPIAKGAYSISEKGVLNFGLEVRTSFRKKGIYGDIFSLILSRYPEIVAAPTTAVDTNLEVFCKFFNPKSTPYLSSFSFPGRAEYTDADRQAMYQRMLESLEKMPAVKIRNAAGFQDIQKVILDYPANKMHIDIRKGGASKTPRLFVYQRLASSDGRPFYSQPPQLFEITPSGKLSKRQNSEASIPGFFDN